MKPFKLRGLVPPVFTPFNEDCSLNLSVIPKYVDYLKSKGVKGILINGTTGEGVSMTIEERMTVTKEWIKHCKPCGMHVMAQVGGCALPHVQQLARHAEASGADSLLTLPELFFKPATVAELVEYLRIISEAAPNTPLLYYHFPAMTGVNLNMTSMVEEAQKSVKTFSGLKLTTPNLDEALSVLTVCKGDVTPFLGCDGLIASAYIMGVESSIGTTFNMVYDHVTSIVNGIKRKTFTEAAQKQKELNLIIKQITVDGAWVPTMKTAMKILTNLDLGPVRSPNKNLTEPQVTEMKKKLNEVLKT